MVVLQVGLRKNAAYLEPTILEKIKVENIRTDHFLSVLSAEMLRFLHRFSFTFFNRFWS